MDKTNLGLVKFAEDALAQRLGYVYGTFGRICTRELLDACAHLYPSDNLAGGPMRRVGEKWLGRRVVDCSGLIKYYLMANTVGDEPIYNPAYDINLFEAASQKGPIDTMPDIPGVCLYMPGHTAVYIGNDVVIESAGTLWGVVKSHLPNCYTGRKWTHWYEAPGIVYEEEKTMGDVSWDTTDKRLGVGESYSALCVVRGTDQGATVRTDHPEIAAIERNQPGYTSRSGQTGNLYTVRGIAPGEARIIASIEGDSASFPVVVG